MFHYELHLEQETVGAQGQLAYQVWSKLSSFFFLLFL